uniref:Uncharacterized protein n=1 Tax=Rhizophora mucronata TaxID=61149 RepID=A0A2P2PUT9_RHIMU
MFLIYYSTFGDFFVGFFLSCRIYSCGCFVFLLYYCIGILLVVEI